VTYGLLDQTTDATSVIAGHRLISNTSSILALSATLDHQTRNLNEFTDGVVSLTDSTGDENGVWTDGTTSATPSDALPGNFEYVGLYNITSPNGSGPAIVGVVTPSAAIPASGTANFTGSGFVEGSTLDGGLISTSANSSFTVNLGTKAAFVTLSSLTGTSEFSQLEITGMTLDATDGTITGGTVLLSSGSTDITGATLGTQISTIAAATLFGIESNATTPAEVGGVFHVSGTDGILFGGFLGR
jgi:hypothetical protein